MKRILIPTDFSENAWNATAYAMQLFNEEECVFFLLNTYTPAILSSRFMAPATGSNVLEDVRSRSEKELKELVQKIKSEFANKRHRFEIRSSFNLLADAVNELVVNEKIDLVVMGTKGASGLGEVFMGSNTVRVIKNVDACPVMAIPQNFDYNEPKEIAFATDFSRFYTASELAPIIEMAQTFKSVVRIVHVQYEIRPLSEVQQFNLTMLRKYLADVDHFVHTVSELHSISKTLKVFSGQLGIHLLAMFHYPHSYMEKMTREPVVKQTAFHTEVPLLVIPELGMGTPVEKRTAPEHLTAD